MNFRVNLCNKKKIGLYRYIFYISSKFYNFLNFWIGDLPLLATVLKRSNSFQVILYISPSYTKSKEKNIIACVHFLSFNTTSLFQFNNASPSNNG